VRSRTNVVLSFADPSTSLKRVCDAQRVCIDDGPRDMDELFVRGTQSVRDSTAIGQVAGLSGLLALLTGTVSVLAAGTIVAGGVVLLIGGMLVVIPFF
jgi:hypothetical protein